MDRKIDANDDHSHTPNGDESWQESWAFQFYDPVTRVAGYCHMGLQPNRGIADCWMWLSVKGELITNYSNLSLPMPEGDYTDLQLGPLRVTSLIPNLSRRVAMKDDKIDCDITYKSFRDEPITLRPKKGGYFAEISSDGHYESLGVVTGRVTVNGEAIDIMGYGYDDRSWGERKWDNMHYRFIWACFGPDLYFALYNVATNNGGHQFGWVYEQGRFHEVRAVDFSIEMNSDGVTARGGKVTAWTDTGTGYSLCVTPDGQSVINQRNGFFACPSLCVAEYGGRRGVALMEIAELKKLTPALVKKYGLDLSY